MLMAVFGKLPEKTIDFKYRLSCMRKSLQDRRYFYAPLAQMGEPRTSLAPPLRHTSQRMLTKSGTKKFKSLFKRTAMLPFARRRLFCAIENLSLLTWYHIPLSRR